MSNYQEYIPNFFPRLRDQARRFSESSPSLSPFPLPPFPQVPDFSAWTARFWNNQSPPASLDESDETVSSESTVQALARTIHLWTQQLNGDPFSPPLEPTLSPIQPAVQDVSTTEFPPLETEVPQARPPRLEDVRANSETTLNPARRLQNRSRMFSDGNRGHSQSDPMARAQASVPQPQQTTPPADVYMEDGQPRRRDGSDALPEDDGMGPLRQRINTIWMGSGTPMEKSMLIHVLMNERHKAARKRHSASRSSTASILPLAALSMTPKTAFNLNERDLAPSYAPLNDEEIEHGDLDAPRPLGCNHYRRNVKLQCFTCDKWYPCRLCHDEAENHTLPRRETRFMLCMLCKTPQSASQTCSACGEPAAHYYCPICKLWQNDPRKSIYHCDDCGICRLGKGLGKDFFHCKTCAACMSIEAQATHRCIEHSTKCDCPICGEFLFTSNLPVAFMKCGHSIHNSCFKDLCDTTYKCPICSKSIANMESQFRRLDRSIEEQPMPVEYRDKRAYIFCNDCLNRCVSPYHWLGTKCIFCDSYNTVQLEMVGEAPSVQIQMQEAAQDRVNDAGIAESLMTASQTHTPIEDLAQPAYPERRPSQHSVPRATSNVNTTVPTSPTVQSPWLMPHSPGSRSVRSVSPVVGSYFGTGAVAGTASGQRALTPTTASAAMSAAAGMAAAAGAEFARRISSVGRATPDTADQNDEDMEFWGGQSPRSNDGVLAENANKDDSESSDDDDDEPMDDDNGEDDDEDIMDVFGHR